MGKQSCRRKHFIEALTGGQEEAAAEQKDPTQRGRRQPPVQGSSLDEKQHK